VEKSVFPFMPTKDPVLSVRLPDDLSDRLNACADKLDLSKNDIARHAIRAAVDEIEKNDFRIALPLKFAVAPEPVASHPSIPELDEIARRQTQGAIVHPGATYANEDPASGPAANPQQTEPPKLTRIRRALRAMASNEGKKSKKKK
jgi:predicted transcriptional regulator